MLSLMIHGVRGSMPTAGRVFQSMEEMTCFEIDTRTAKYLLTLGQVLVPLELMKTKKSLPTFHSFDHDHAGLLFNPRLFTGNREIVVSSAPMGGGMLKNTSLNTFHPHSSHRMFFLRKMSKFCDFDQFILQKSPISLLTVSV